MGSRAPRHNIQPMQRTSSPAPSGSCGTSPTERSPPCPCHRMGFSGEGTQCQMQEGIPQSRATAASLPKSSKGTPNSSLPAMHWWQRLVAGFFELGLVGLLVNERLKRPAFAKNGASPLTPKQHKKNLPPPSSKPHSNSSFSSPATKSNMW